MIRTQHSRRGYEASEETITDLAQSIFGSEGLVSLIQEQEFSEEAYGPVIEEELVRVSRELFPDVSKRHVISLNKLQDDYNVELAVESDRDAGEEISIPEPTVSEDEILAYLQGKLNPESLEYLSFLFNEQEQIKREFIWNDRIYSLIDNSIEYLEQKIADFRKLYPRGEFFDQEKVNVQAALTEDEIIGCYKNVFLGIYRKFPMNFLSYDPLHRCALLTQFAIDQIWRTTPFEVLQNSTCADFGQIGLQGVVRHFNYSLVRCLRNAYPGLIEQWEFGHVRAKFWENAENRRKAIHWMVEEKLGIPYDQISASLRKKMIKKSTFAKYGLSYLFAEYYKSVARAIRFAYPEFMPWELGSVPNSFWQGEEGQQNIKLAVNWLLDRLNVTVSDIPAKIKDKTLGKATFAQYGMATVFERIFKKNMYKLIDTVYPNRFQIWEIGKVPSEYWSESLNRHQACLWVAKKNGIKIEGLRDALRTGLLNLNTFKKLGLGSMLKNHFENDLKRAMLPYLLPTAAQREEIIRELILVSIVNRQVKQLRSTYRYRGVLRRIKFPFFIIPAPVKDTIRHLERMKKRISTRIGEISAKAYIDI